MQNDRGGIHSSDRARQLKDYSNLRFGNITPTDIDGLIEYQGKGFIIIELKLNDNPIPYGQKLALERLTDDLAKPAICIIVTHNIDDVTQDIDVGNCVVTEYRFKGGWRTPKTHRTAREFIDIFIEFIDGYGK